MRCRLFFRPRFVVLLAVCRVLSYTRYERTRTVLFGPSLVRTPPVCAYPPEPLGRSLVRALWHARGARGGSIGSPTNGGGTTNGGGDSGFIVEYQARARALAPWLGLRISWRWRWLRLGGRLWGSCIVVCDPVPSPSPCDIFVCYHQQRPDRAVLH